MSERRMRVIDPWPIAVRKILYRWVNGELREVDRRILLSGRAESVLLRRECISY